jgi:hypothetical protein
MDNKTTFLSVVENTDEHLSESLKEIKRALWDAEITQQEREVLTDIAMDLIDLSHKLINAKHINP